MNVFNIYKPFPRNSLNISTCDLAESCFLVEQKNYTRN